MPTITHPTRPARLSRRPLPTLALLLMLGALPPLFTACGGGGSGDSSTTTTGSTDTGTGTTGTGTTGTGTTGTGTTGTGTGTDTTGTGSTGTGTGTTDTGTGTTPVTSSWTLATGANPADSDSSLSAQRVNLALDTVTVTSASTAVTVGATRNGSVPLLMNGATVGTVSQDTLGITVALAWTGNSVPELALTGSGRQTVTITSTGPFKLTLDGVRISSADGPAINIQSKVRAFVTLTGDSTLTDTGTYSARTLADGTAMDLKATFFSEGPLIVGGAGTLAVTAASKHAMASDAHVRLRGGSLTLVAQKKDGLRPKHAFVMDGGALKITTPAGKALKVEGEENASSTPLGFIAINGGSIDITSHDKAITASWESAEDGSTATLADDPDPRVTINGGTLTITTTGTPYEDTNLADGDSSLSPEGIEAKSVLTINGGLITVNSTDDALNAGQAIAIHGGRVYAKASRNDAIDSNGTLTLTGGVVVADGASGAEGGLDCDNNTFTITGGTFIGLGGRNSTPTRSVTTQNTLVLRNVAAGLLVVRDTSGRAVFAFTMPKAASGVVLGSAALATGSSVSVLQGGTLGAGGEVFNGLELAPGSHSGGSTLVNSFTISSSVTSL